MSRSVKKGPYVDEKLMKKVRKARSTGARDAIRTWARSSMMMPDMVGLTLGHSRRPTVYSGPGDREHGGAPPGRIRPDTTIQGSLLEDRQRLVS